MYTTFHLRADELNDEVIQILKTTYRQDEIVILPKGAYAEIEKFKHNAAFTEKLQQGIQDIEQGRGIIKTVAELEAMELSYTYEKGEKYLVGYLDDYPEYPTQGEDTSDLENHLKDIYMMIQDGTLEAKYHGVLKIA